MAALSAIKSAFYSVREQLTPVLQESAFLEKGVLTPDEFVAAGDNLTYKAPTWKWMLAERGDPSLEKSYLPHDKQYLVTRGVPCPRRASAVAEALAPDRWALFTPADGIEGDWVETNLAEPPAARRTTAAGEGSAGAEEEEDEDDGGGVADLTGSGSGLDTHQQRLGITTAASAGIGSAAQAPAASAAGSTASASATPAAVVTEAAATSTTVAAAADGDDDEYDDLSAFVGEALMVSDPAAVPVPLPVVVQPPAPAPQAALPTGTTPPSVGAAMTTTAAAVGSAPVAGISGSAAAAATAGRHAAARHLQARKYDISITYDRYYQTPRVYLKGYDGRGVELTPDEMLEDVMQDYANRTATIEQHPHAPGLGHHISIHPCRHASVMKRLIDNMIGGISTQEARALLAAQQQHQQQQRDQYWTGSGSGSGAGVGLGSSAKASQASFLPPQTSGQPQPRIPTVDSYLFIFLKFLQTMIPTIDYDFTQAARMG